MYKIIVKRFWAKKNRFYTRIPQPARNVSFTFKTIIIANIAFGRFSDIESRWSHLNGEKCEIQNRKNAIENVDMNHDITYFWPQISDVNNSDLQIAPKSTQLLFWALNRKRVHVQTPKLIIIPCNIQNVSALHRRLVMNGLHPLGLGCYLEVWVVYVRNLWPKIFYVMVHVTASFM